jgi:aspartate carbamoyltransferase catalytic subunit
MLMQHYIRVTDFTQAQLLKLLQHAQSFIHHNSVCSKPLLSNIAVANLFFEPSTRTLASFELAAKKLNADVLTLPIETSSVNKGETVLDTVKNLEAMGVKKFVVRHKQTIMQELAEQLNSTSQLICAGEGAEHHPSQALLDMLTIQQHKKNFENLAVTIVGDVLHSRVARSDIRALKILGCNDIRLVAPQQFLPTDLDGLTVEIDFDKAVADVDVIIMLRIQHERLPSEMKINHQQYIAQYQLNAQRLAKAKSNAIVMHPGPMNRGVEITNEIADGPQSVILQQVHNGVAARMAILTMNEVLE